MSFILTLQNSSYLFANQNNYYVLIYVLIINNGSKLNMSIKIIIFVRMFPFAE
jgi:hypothetical protein